MPITQHQAFLVIFLVFPGCGGLLGADLFAGAFLAAFFAGAFLAAAFFAVAIISSLVGFRASPSSRAVAGEPAQALASEMASEMVHCFRFAWAIHVRSGTEPVSSLAQLLICCKHSVAVYGSIHV